MEDKNASKQLIDKIIRSFPDLKVIQFRDRIDSTVKHFEFSRGLHGRTCSGFGSDHCLDTAVRKAFSELLERQAFWLNCQASDGGSVARTTSGYAAHLDLARAVAAAECELIERDAFFWMWYSRVSPTWLTDKELSALGIQGSDVLNLRLRKFELKVRFGIIASTGAIVTVIGLLECSEGGFAVSTSAAATPAQALASVYFDLRRLANVSINRRCSPSPTGDFRSQGERWTAEDHCNYAMRQVRAPDWLTDNISSRIPLLPPFAIQTEVIEKFDKPYDVWIVRASSEDCFHYFLGPTKLEQINRLRAESLGVSLSEVNMELHPLP